MDFFNKMKMLDLDLMLLNNNTKLMLNLLRLKFNLLLNNLNSRKIELNNMFRVLLKMLIHIWLNKTPNQFKLIPKFLSLQITTMLLTLLLMYNLRIRRLPTFRLILRILMRDQLLPMYRVSQEKLRLQHMSKVFQEKFLEKLLHKTLLSNNLKSTIKLRLRLTPTHIQPL